MVRKALKTFLQWLFVLLLRYAISLNVRSHSRLITCSGSSSPTPKKTARSQIVHAANSLSSDVC